MKNGVFTNLIAQLEKLNKHNRQGSYKTRKRYYEAMKRFSRFLAETYQLQKLSNIAPKHLHSYIEYMQTSGHSPSTIKTDLCAIRFFHDQIPKPRYTLPDNSAFQLERRSYGKEDRTWSHQEFISMLRCSAVLGRDDYTTALCLGYYAGMRVEECFTIDTAMAEKALRDHEITFHGKGGRWRTVPINSDIAGQLRIMLSQARRGSKLLSPDNLSVEDAIRRFQNFIIKNRDASQDPERVTSLTAHGLRHTYARNQYLGFRQQGISHELACKKVSLLLGHDRLDVTRIYLASIAKDGERNV